MSYYFVVSVLFTRDSWKLQSSRTSSISIFHQNSLHPSPQVHSIPLDPVVSTIIGCGIPLLSRRSGSESQCIGSTSSSRIKSITLTPSRRYLEGFICGSGCPSCVSSNGPALGQPWVNLTSNLSGNPLRPPALTSTLLNQHPPSIPPPVKLQTSTSKVFKSRVRGAPQFLTRSLELETCRLLWLCSHCEMLALCLLLKARVLSSFKMHEGFFGMYKMRLLQYHFVLQNFYVGSPTLIWVLPSSSDEESISQSCLSSMNGDALSDYLLSPRFNLLTYLLSCVAVCTGPEGAIETTLCFLVGEGCSSTSLVTISQLSDFVVASSTHSNFVLDSLSTSYEDLSCLISFSIVVYDLPSRGCLIPSCPCKL